MPWRWAILLMMGAVAASLAYDYAITGTPVGPTLTALFGPSAS